MLEAKNITFRVGNKDLLSDISVCFPPGRLHLIVGPNGAGKSTLIKVLARLLKPAQGWVEYDGIDVRDEPYASLAKRRAVLSQAVEAAFPLSVREIVMMGRYPHFGGRPGATDEAVVDEMMELFDVKGFENRQYQTLSGGERQRVNFARVLAQLRRAGGENTDAAAFPTSRYLFLDEPLTFLDVRHQLDFMKMVRAFAAELDAVTVGVVHDLNLAARFADQVVLLNDGRVVAKGTPAVVLDANHIRDVFHVEMTSVSAQSSSVHLIFD